MHLKSVSPALRPREKLIRYGPGKLSDAELLAILFRTGTEGENVVEVARRVLRTCGRAHLSDAGLEELKKTPGVGTVKACEIIACFELGRRFLKDKKTILVLSPHDVWDALKDLRDNKKEHFVVFFLDVRNQEIRREIVSLGTLNANLVHPREVFEPAIAHAAAQILIAHNHPSGDPTPSEEDSAVTSRLREAGELLGIRVLDHVIVTKNAFFSFKEEGLL